MTTGTEPASNASIVDVTPELLERWLSQGDTVLIDVREDFEHAAERVAGSVHVPLSRFDAEQVRARHPGQRIVFHCRTGARSAEAASRFASGDKPAFHLAGGLEAWKAADCPCERSASAPRLDVMRQVQVTAGSLVALGVALGVTVSPWFLVIPGFVGCGLVFAGATGWCGMAKMLAKMPWNRVTTAPIRSEATQAP